MVSHSNYSRNKAFKRNNIKQQFLRKKTKQKKETTYLQNKNTLNNRKTKKRKHTKKGEQFKGSLKSKKKTPVNINKNTKNLKKVQLIEQSGSGFFSSCIKVPIKNIKKKYYKLDTKLKKNLVPFMDIMSVMKNNYLINIKKQYNTILINKRKKFNQEIKRDEFQGSKSSFDNQIRILNININDSESKVDIKLDKVRSKMRKYNKLKKQYEKVSKVYMKYTEKLMYGINKGKMEPDKKSFNYKINQILNIIESAESTSENSEESKEYKKCKRTYDSTKAIYTDIKSKIGENIFLGDSLVNDIGFIDSFISKSGLKHSKNMETFRNKWEDETKKFYNEIKKLVPEQTLERIKTNNPIKGLDYKSKIEEIEVSITEIYNIFYQTNESVLNINVVRVLDHIKQFIEGIKNTQIGIGKDLRKLKEGFLNLQDTAILKLYSNYIIRAHLQNTKLLVCIKYYFENITNQKAIDLFSTTNTYDTADPTKRARLEQNLGMNKLEQNVQEQRVFTQPAVPISTTMSAGGIMENVDNILKSESNFIKYKTDFENLISKNLNIGDGSGGSNKIEIRIIEGEKESVKKGKKGVAFSLPMQGIEDLFKLLSNIK
tara:strand:+ start:1135 stop:2934 length:1800 start_codon:yes stop_codon:yes gene_type:complete